MHFFNRVMHRPCVVFLLFALTHFACAQTSRKQKPCGSYDTQSEMNECAAREAHEADATLNASYRELLGKIKNATAKARLVAAEKAWIAFRDAELASDWPVAPGENPNATYGSVHPFCYYSELAALTRERAQILKQRMGAIEGDLCSTALASRLASGPTQCATVHGKRRAAHS